jgi:hypothetical protein
VSEQFDRLNSPADIHALINQGIRESDVLEYKSVSGQFTDGEKNQIPKDVAAMANANGGVIVYGVMTRSADKTLPDKPCGLIDPKNPDIFDQVITSKVRPPIVGLKKKLIPNVAPHFMVIDVPASDDRPHQSLVDHKYYRRSGTENSPMDHDLVSMQFGRRTGPVLAVHLTRLVNFTTIITATQITNEMVLRVEVRNEGKRTAHHVELVLIFPSRDIVEVATKSGAVEGIDRLYMPNQARMIRLRDQVVHPGVTISVAELGFVFRENYFVNHQADPMMKWTVNAEDMVQKDGEISLAELGWTP